MESDCYGDAVAMGGLGGCFEGFQQFTMMSWFLRSPPPSLLPLLLHDDTRTHDSYETRARAREIDLPRVT